MTLQELCNYFNTTESTIRTNFPKFATRQLKKGILIEREGVYPNTVYTISKVEPKEVEKDYFVMKKKEEDTQIIDGEEWIDCIVNNKYEISNFGRVRNKENKKINSGYINKNGYRIISLSHQNYFAHRLVLQSFNPIENSDIYSVDHINGIRHDNRLENLRWVTQDENTLFMLLHRKELNKELTRIINKFGYDKTLKILQNL